MPRRSPRLDQLTRLQLTRSISAQLASVADQLTRFHWATDQLTRLKLARSASGASLQLTRLQLTRCQSSVRVVPSSSVLSGGSLVGADVGLSCALSTAASALATVSRHRVGLDRVAGGVDERRRRSGLVTARVRLTIVALTCCGVQFG